MILNPYIEQIKDTLHDWGVIHDLLYGWGWEYKTENNCYTLYENKCYNLYVYQISHEKFIKLPHEDRITLCKSLERKQRKRIKIAERETEKRKKKNLKETGSEYIFSIPLINRPFPKIL